MRNASLALGLGAAVGAALAAAPAAAQEDPVKIGLMLTLSGPPAALGQMARNGFELAMDELGGEMAGRPVELIVVDDELQPDGAVQKARTLVERDDVDFVVGPIFSNILQAIFKPVVEADKILISPNAGTSTFAGRACSPNFFAVSYQNDQVHEVMGAVAKQRGYEDVFLLAPNYQAGRDSIAGFKRSYEGNVVDEVYTPLDQLDFSAELARIAAAQPDALFVFMPGGLGVNFVRQFRQAGLADAVPFLSAFTVDEATLPAQKQDAVGLLGAMTWAPDMDNPQSREFVAAYEAKYDQVPGSYAMQAYDAAMLIDSALEATGGDLSDQDAVLEALRQADFTSLRGDFAFNNNNFPIQDFYVVEVAERPDGKFQTTIAERVFEAYGDAYAEECDMPPVGG